jgi:hypothetical protein
MRQLRAPTVSWAVCTKIVPAPNVQSGESYPLRGRTARQVAHMTAKGRQSHFHGPPRASRLCMRCPQGVPIILERDGEAVCDARTAGFKGGSMKTIQQSAVLGERHTGEVQGALVFAGRGQQPSLVSAPLQRLILPPLDLQPAFPPRTWKINAGSAPARQTSRANLSPGSAFPSMAGTRASMSARFRLLPERC